MAKTIPNKKAQKTDPRTPDMIAKVPNSSPVFSDFIPMARPRRNPRKAPKMSPSPIIGFAKLIAVTALIFLKECDTGFFTAIFFFFYAREIQLLQ